MATCVGCGAQVGCGCGLVGGLCAACLAKQQTKLCYILKYQTAKNVQISYL